MNAVLQVPRPYRRWLGLAGFLALTFLAAGLGSLSGPDDWYAALHKPPWNPPNAVFAPVWLVLYLMIAVSGWRVLLADDAPWKRTALGLWFAQWLLNGMWTPLFFSMHRPGLALLDLCLLIGAVAAFIRRTWQPDRLAAWLFIPYLAWVVFAASLNGAIVWLNP